MWVAVISNMPELFGWLASVGVAFYFGYLRGRKAGK